MTPSMMSLLRTDCSIGGTVLNFSLPWREFVLHGLITKAKLAQMHEGRRGKVKRTACIGCS
jgi:hypothetical protein